MRWILTNEWNEERMTRVDITLKGNDEEALKKLPEPSWSIQNDAEACCRIFSVRT